MATFERTVEQVSRRPDHLQTSADYLHNKSYALFGKGMVLNRKSSLLQHKVSSVVAYPVDCWTMINTNVTSPLRFCSCSARSRRSDITVLGHGVTIL